MGRNLPQPRLRHHQITDKNFHIKSSLWKGDGKLKHGGDTICLTWVKKGELTASHPYLQPREMTARRSHRPSRQVRVVSPWALIDLILWEKVLQKKIARNI
jgi:hypothetical protein